MLTRAHGIAVFKNNRAFPDCLTRQRHAAYLQYAEQMLQVYRNGIGRPRGELHRAIHRIFENTPDCPLRRIHAFCKLLDDASEYETDRSAHAATLRQKIFQMAAAWHPLVETADKLFEHTISSARQNISQALGMSWADIAQQLFADVFELQRLRVFHGYPDATALLARYNVAQAQVLLYDATRMLIRAQQDLKTILRGAKICGLLHTITYNPVERIYQIELTGPASELRNTHRYGAAMAKFLPILLACRQWHMQAVIARHRGHWKTIFALSAADGLHSHLPEPEEFDSTVEAAFARKWGKTPRTGWTLERESEVLHKQQKVFIPDFVFRHADGRKVLLEIVGFWTPQYLEAKLATLAAFGKYPILLAVTEKHAARFAKYAKNIIWYKTALKVSDVMERLNVIPPLTTAGAVIP